MNGTNPSGAEPYNTGGAGGDAAFVKHPNGGESKTVAVAESGASIVNERRVGSPREQPDSALYAEGSQRVPIELELQTSTVIAIDGLGTNESKTIKLSKIAPTARGKADTLADLNARGTAISGGPEGGSISTESNVDEVATNMQRTSANRIEKKPGIKHDRNERATTAPTSIAGEQTKGISPDNAFDAWDDNKLHQSEVVNNEPNPSVPASLPGLTKSISDQPAMSFGVAKTGDEKGTTNALGVTRKPTDGEPIAPPDSSRDGAKLAQAEAPRNKQQPEVPASQSQGQFVGSTKAAMVLNSSDAPAKPETLGVPVKPVGGERTALTENSWDGAKLAQAEAPRNKQQPEVPASQSQGQFVGSTKAAMVLNSSDAPAKPETLSVPVKPVGGERTALTENSWDGAKLAQAEAPRNKQQPEVPASQSQTNSDSPARRLEVANSSNEKEKNVGSDGNSPSFLQPPTSSAGAEGNVAKGLSRGGGVGDGVTAIGGAEKSLAEPRVASNAAGQALDHGAMANRGAVGPGSLARADVDDGQRAGFNPRPMGGLAEANSAFGRSVVDGGVAGHMSGLAQAGGKVDGGGKVEGGRDASGLAGAGRGSELAGPGGLGLAGRGLGEGVQGGREPGGRVAGEQGGRLPGEQGGRLPGEQGGRLPGEQGGRLPGEAGGRAPGELAGRLPGEHGGRVPGELGGRAPGEHGVKAPGEHGVKAPGEHGGPKGAAEVHPPKHMTEPTGKAGEGHSTAPGGHVPDKGGRPEGVGGKAAEPDKTGKTEGGLPGGHKTIVPGGEEEGTKVPGKKEPTRELPPEANLQALLDNISRGKGKGEITEHGEELGGANGKTDPFGNSLNTQGHILGTGTGKADPDPTKAHNVDPNAPTAGAVQAWDPTKLLPELEIFDPAKVEAARKQELIANGLVPGQEFPGIVREPGVQYDPRTFNGAMNWQEDAGGTPAPPGSKFDSGVAATAGGDPGLPYGMMPGDDGNIRRAEAIEARAEQAELRDRKEIIDVPVEREKEPPLPRREDFDSGVVSTVDDTRPPKEHVARDKEDKKDEGIVGRLESLVDAMITDAATGRSVENPESRILIDNLFEEGEREQYTVYEGDTLESIARRKLKDRRYAPLLYSLNRDTLGHIKDFKNHQLPPGAVLHLPSMAETMRFKVHVLADTTPLLVYVNTHGKLQASDKPSETDAPLTYTCRLGDTLLSIATRHPALRDAALWKLLAKINNLSTETDANGLPAVKLKRGKVLRLPKPKEIENYRNFLLAQSLEETLPQLGRTVLANRTFSVDPVSKAGDSTDASDPGKAMYESRVITQTDLGEGNTNLLLRLAVKTRERWMPVVEYVVTDHLSGLKFYDFQGERKNIRIDLPTRAARELAENDLAVNAQQYCAKFLAGALPF
jgi:hypothetical protein